MSTQHDRYNEAIMAIMALDDAWVHMHDEANKEHNENFALQKRIKELNADNKALCEQRDHLIEDVDEHARIASSNLRRMDEYEQTNQALRAQLADQAKDLAIFVPKIQQLEQANAALKADMHEQFERYRSDTLELERERDDFKAMYQLADEITAAVINVHFPPKTISDDDLVFYIGHFAPDNYPVLQ